MLSSAAYDGLSISKVACKRAINAFEMGNDVTAIDLITDATQMFKSWALIYLELASIFVAEAATSVMSVDHNLKKKKRMIESSSRAIELSLYFIEYAYFFAKFLYKDSKEIQEVDQVLSLCGKALSVFLIHVG
ncbi:hypothetical protein QQ045_007370 [Rhodiola kirilowii]